MTSEQLVSILVINGLAVVVLWLFGRWLSGNPSAHVVAEQTGHPTFDNMDMIFAHATNNSHYEGVQGGELNSYFDSDDALLAPNGNLSSLFESIQKAVIGFPNAKLCFIEQNSGPVGTLPLAVYLSTQLKRPAMVYRLNRDVDAMAFKGADIEEGDEVLLVHDLIRTGSHLERVQREIEKRGGRLVKAVYLISRQPESERLRDNPAIEIQALRDMDRIDEVRNSATFTSSLQSH